MSSQACFKNINGKSGNGKKVELLQPNNKYLVVQLSRENCRSEQHIIHSFLTSNLFHPLKLDLFLINHFKFLSFIGNFYVLEEKLDFLL